jgi:5'-AMP-activated protein kinase catalytic alpha subunit
MSRTYNLKPRKENEVRKYFQQLISGVEYLHKMGITHRDLKPDNIMIDYYDDVKIIDFGLSNTFSSGQILTSDCGTLYYAAPELLEKNY